jgi:hypothetical protein
VEVTVSIWRTIIIHNDIDPFHVDSPTKDIRSDKDALLECLERCVTFDTIDPDMNKTPMAVESSATYRSSWAKPEWMLILGKLQETSSLSSSMARATDFTKMTTSGTR